MKNNGLTSAALAAAGLAIASFTLPVLDVARSACVQAEETACPEPPDEPKHIDADAPEHLAVRPAEVTRPVRGGYFAAGYFSPNYFARGYFAEPT